MYHSTDTKQTIIWKVRREDYGWKGRWRRLQGAGHAPCHLWCWINTLVCRFYKNSQNCTFNICVHFCMYIIRQNYILKLPNWKKYMPFKFIKIAKVIVKKYSNSHGWQAWDKNSYALLVWLSNGTSLWKAIWQNVSRTLKYAWPLT